MKNLKKRGLEFLSWVLLIALSVALGTFTFIWMKDFSGGAIDQAVKVVYNTEECYSISVKMDSICQDLAVIKLNLTNNNKRDINRLVFRLYDIYGNPETRELNITIKPDEQAELKVIKQGTIEKFEVVPVTFKNELEAKKTEIHCRTSIAQKEKIEFCP